MGKMVCSELDNGGEGLDLTGFFLALVIALALMVVCAPPPRRKIVAVHRVWFTVSLGQQNYRRETEKWIEKRKYKSSFLLVLSGDLETRRPVMAPLGWRKTAADGGGSLGAGEDDEELVGDERCRRSVASHVVLVRREQVAATCGEQRLSCGGAALGEAEALRLFSGTVGR
ncbi:hypothetical protein U1Q18_020096 [Sarracenia purpurea var. burkii]